IVSSTEAVQITRVLPTSIRHEPSAVETNSGTMLTGRNCSGARLSERKTTSLLLFFNVDQLDVFDWVTQERPSEPAEFFHRIGSIAAQAAGTLLSAVFAQEPGHFDGGRLRRIYDLHVRRHHASQQRADERIVSAAQQQHVG